MKALSGRARRLIGSLAMELASQRGEPDSAVAATILETLLETCERVIQDEDQPAEPGRPDRPGRP